MSCKTKVTTTTAHRHEVVAYSDTAYLLRIRLADLVQLETLRSFPNGDTLTLIRSVRIQARHADTLSRASFALGSRISADTLQTTVEHTSYGSKQKKGLAWLRTNLVYAGLFILLIFLLWYWYVKKK